jgi:hypothetical protein
MLRAAQAVAHAAVQALHRRRMMHMTAIWAKLFPGNMGRAEQYVRVVFGGVLIGLALSVPSAWGWIGLIPLLTGVSGSCPLYRMLGVQPP